MKHQTGLERHHIELPFTPPELYQKSCDRQRVQTCWALLFSRTQTWCSSGHTNKTWTQQLPTKLDKTSNTTPTTTKTTQTTQTNYIHFQHTLHWRQVQRQHQTDPDATQHPCLTHQHAWPHRQGTRQKTGQQENLMQEQSLPRPRNLPAVLRRVQSDVHHLWRLLHRNDHTKTTRPRPGTPNCCLRALQSLCPWRALPHSAPQPPKQRPTDPTSHHLRSAIPAPWHSSPSHRRSDGHPVTPAAAESTGRAPGNGLPSELILFNYFCSIKNFFKKASSFFFTFFPFLLSSSSCTDTHPPLWPHIPSFDHRTTHTITHACTAPRTQIE